VLSQPKGIFVNKLRSEKIVHIKATSLVLFNPLMVLLNAFSSLLLSLWARCSDAKIPQSNEGKRETRKSFSSWKLRGGFYRTPLLPRGEFLKQVMDFVNEAILVRGLTTFKSISFIIWNSLSGFFEALLSSIKQTKC
jgi:hypothetical protein